MKHIAIVYRNLAGLSGVPNVVFAQARALSAAGYAVDLLAQKTDRERARAAGAGVVKVRRLPGPKRWGRRWFARRADRTARRYDFVIGHGHHREQNVLMLHNSIRLANERIGADRPDDADALLQDWILSSGRFELCIANSGLMRNDLQRRYGIDAERIHVVYPGYDTARFNPECRGRYRGEVRRELGVRDETLLIGLVTSGAFHKRGVDILLGAYARLPESVRRAARLLVVGRSSPEAWLSLARSLGIAGGVAFRPAVSEVERYYAALDIGVHPARFEEFGLTVEEMMACGLPVITNRQVGAAELLPPQAREQLPEQSDPDVLAGQIERFAGDAGLRRQWSEYGIAAAGGNSFDISFQRTLDVCRKVGL